MKIFGFDFTSAPGPRKQIVGVSAQLTANILTVDPQLIQLDCLERFETFLGHPGPWLAGFDFPFGQPRRLIRNLGWSLRWAGYVDQVASMGQPAFEAAIATYRQARPPGDKHHLRTTDARAGAISPMMLHGVPVGKMFFKGAPRLLRAGVCILPCHPVIDDRIALETYPALAARKWLGRRSYKSDTPSKQTADRAVARRELLSRLNSSQLEQQYGLSLKLDPTMVDQLVEEPSADRLDALLCALQAAWAYRQRRHNFGIPAGCDPLEGWIVDPALTA